MMNKRAYKNMLAVAVVAALSGTTVWAADETSTATTQNSTAAVTAVSAQDQAAQDAITAARGGIEEAQKSDEQEAKRIELDNSSLATTDSAVLTVAKGEGARLEEQQAAGVQTAITTPDARYFSSVTDEQLQPYEGKVMTGFSIEGLPAGIHGLVKEPYR